MTQETALQNKTPEEQVNGISTAAPEDVEKQPPRIAIEDGPVKVSAFKSLGILDRFLAVWILLAMVVGILLSNFVDETGPALQRGKFVGVSIPIAIGLLVMMYPILCKVRYESLHKLLLHRDIWKQIAFSVFVNWIVAPFVMVRTSHYHSGLAQRHMILTLAGSLHWLGPSYLTRKISVSA